MGNLNEVFAFLILRALRMGHPSAQEKKEASRKLVWFENRFIRKTAKTY